MADEVEKLFAVPIWMYFDLVCDATVVQDNEPIRVVETVSPRL